MNPEPADDFPQPAVPPAESNPGEAGHPSSASPIVLTGNLDYEVLNMIGRGGYGEVYLARAKDGSFFAVKVVYRVSFDDQRPYEREYEGIRYFEPVSKLSESQLQILRVGRRDEAGYFYYIMEAADDVAASRQIHPETYIPRTLKSEMQQHGGRIPVRACCEIGLALAAALENLHSHRLVHRDIKPANIIFVHGNAKLADPGLVAAADQSLTCVGTEGYIPPEGPGSPRADIYALGMVLYEAFTGFHRQDFPQLPEDLADWPEHALALNLNKIVTRACQANLRRRYQSAREVRRDLDRLVEWCKPPVAAGTPHRTRRWQPAFAAVILLAAAVGVLWFRHQPAMPKEESSVAHGSSQPMAVAPVARPAGSVVPPITATPMAVKGADSAPTAELQTLLTGTFPNGNGGAPWPVRNIYRLVPGADGNFYGSTGWGKKIVRLTPDGCLTTVAAMAEEGYINDLIPMPDGRAFFVTTRGVPSHDNFGRFYCLSLSGNLSLLSVFSKNQTPRPDRMSYNPFDHDFYGVDWGEKGNYGFIVQMTLSGATRILGSFDEDNGRNPRGGVVFWGGEICGSTESGGKFKKGAVFSANTNGMIHLLHSFDGRDGQWPLSGLVSGPDGLFYGTAAVGGKHGQGTVFQVSPTGDFKLLASLSGIQRPRAGTLCYGRDGNLYGVTETGGNAGDLGAIFRLLPGGDLQTLWSFNGANGACPRDLIQGADGNLYGICHYGGVGFTNGDPQSGSGTVFRLLLADHRRSPVPKQNQAPLTMPLADAGQTGDWQMFSPSEPAPQAVHWDKGVIILDRPDSLVTSRNSAYEDVNFTVELEAVAGTEAFVGVRLQQRDGLWVGMTSCVYDDGTQMLAGNQWSNFQGGKVEHGETRVAAPYGGPLKIHLSMKDLLIWISVNGKTTSGVDYHQRFHTDAGCVGIKLVKGSVRITKLEVEPIE